MDDLDYIEKLFETYYHNPGSIISRTAIPQELCNLYKVEQDAEILFQYRFKVIPMSHILRNNKEENYLAMLKDHIQNGSDISILNNRKRIEKIIKFKNFK